MNKPKEQIVAWMIFDADGFGLLWTCEFRRRACIDYFTTNYEYTMPDWWREWNRYYKKGWRCKKVIILTVPRSKGGVKIRMEYEK